MALNLQEESTMPEAFCHSSGLNELGQFQWVRDTVQMMVRYMISKFKYFSKIGSRNKYRPTVI